MVYKLEIPEEVVWTDLGDEVVILNLQTGIYFGLEQVGARVWKLIADGNARDQITDIVAGEYSAPRDGIQRDIEELLSDLSREGLLAETSAGSDRGDTA